MQDKTKTLTPEAVQILTFVQRKLRGDFLGFYDSLDSQFPAKDKEIHNVVAGWKSKVEQLNQMLGEVIRNEGEVSESQIASINKAYGSVSKDLTALKRNIKLDPETAKYLEVTERTTGNSVDSLLRTITVMEGRTNKVFTQTVTSVDKWKKLASPAVEVMTEIGKSALSSVLGPFGQVAEKAFTVGKGFYTQRKERKQTLERKALTKDLALETDKTPTGMKSLYSGLFGGGGKAPIGMDIGKGMGTSGIPGLGRPPGETTSSPRQSFAENVMDKIPGFGTPTGKKEATIGIVAALVQFFNGPAYKAKWTRELLESIQDKFGKPSKEGKADSDNSKTTWITALGGGIGTAISATLGAVVGAAGDIASRKLAEKVGVNYTPNMNATLPDPVGVAGGWTTAFGFSRGQGLAKKMLGKETGREGKSTLASKAWDWVTGKKTSSKGLEGGAGLNEGDPRLNDAKFMAEAKATIAKRGVIASTTEKVPTEKIPLVIDQQGTKNQLGLDQINKTLVTVAEEVKKGNDAKKFPHTQSGKNAYNSKNPLVSALSYGVVSTE